jgi:hypothetical protein
MALPLVRFWVLGTWGRPPTPCARPSTTGCRGRIGRSSRGSGTRCSPRGRTSPFRLWRRPLKKLLTVDQRFQTAYLLKESFDQLCGSNFGRCGHGGSSTTGRTPRNGSGSNPSRSSPRRSRGTGAGSRRTASRRTSSPWGRRGGQHQDPGHSAPGLRPPGRRVPSLDGPHLHAARDLKVSQSTHSITR